jgi:hypothetical protein
MIARRIDRLAVDYVIYAPLGVSLAQECERHCVSADALVLGGEQNCVIFDGRAIHIHRGDRHSNSFSQPVCTAGVRCWPKAAELGDAIGRQLSRIHRTCCQRSRNGST